MFQFTLHIEVAIMQYLYEFSTFLQHRPKVLLCSQLTFLFITQVLLTIVFLYAGSSEGKSLVQQLISFLSIIASHKHNYAFVNNHFMCQKIIFFKNNFGYRN